MNVLQAPEMHVSPWFWKLKFWGLSIPVWLLCIFMTGALPFIRFWLQGLVFKPLMKFCLEDPAKQQTRGAPCEIHKWNDACWEALSYSVFSGIAIYACASEKWLADPSRMWIGCTGLPCNLSIPYPVLALYLGEVSWYANDFTSLMLLHPEQRRKDHFMTVMHHVVTLVLIIYAFALNFTRVGCVVFLLNDSCDAVLPIAKLLKYSKKGFVAKIGYFMFAILWMVCRIYYFPVYFLASLEDSFRILVIPHNVDPNPHLIIFFSACTCLYALQVAWAIKIVSFAYQMFSIKHDVRK